MNALVGLVAAAIFAAPPEPAVTIPLRLSKGQELVYHGVYTEESSRPGARYTRHYDIEVYVLILDAVPKEMRAAFLTVQKLRVPASTSAPIVRLEIGKIDPQGRVTLSQRALTQPPIPTAGPPSLETAAFIETPKQGVDAGAVWQTVIGAEPPTRWSVIGVENVGGRCVRLLGEQRAPNWEELGKPAWKREDRIWLQQQNGFASKIERTIQNRDESGAVIIRTHFSAELENSHNPVFHPGGTFKARQMTIDRVIDLARVLDDLQFGGGAPDVRGFESLLHRLEFAIKNAAATPYRQALIALQRQAELGRNGERAPISTSVETPRFDVRPLVLGQALQDCVLTETTRSDRIRLKDFRGKPALLVFLKGSSATIDYVLRYMATAESRYRDSIHLLPLIVDGPDAVLARAKHMNLSMRMYGGSDLHRTSAGEATPLFVLLDKTGTIRLIAPGWGGEYPDWFEKEIQKTLHP